MFSVDGNFIYLRKIEVNYGILYQTKDCHMIF